MKLTRSQAFLLLGAVVLVIALFGGQLGLFSVVSVNDSAPSFELSQILFTIGNFEVTGLIALLIVGGLILISVLT